MADINLGELMVSTDEKRTKKPSDMVKNANILFHTLDKKGNVSSDLEGRQIYEEFRFAQNSAYQAIDPTQEINLTFNQTFDAFVYSPKQSVIPVMISELEKAQNQGPLGVLNILKERSSVAESTMINEICTDLNGDGTGRSGRAFAGIKSYISDTPGAGLTGGVLRSAAPAIQNVATDLPSTYTGATSSSNIEDRILATKNQITSGNDEFLGYAGSTFFRYMAEALRGRQRLTNETLETAGFKDYIMIEGIPFFLAGGYNKQSGSVIAADRFYIFAPEVFKFRTYKGYNMQALPTRVSTRQLVDVGLRLTIGQFTCNDPSRTAVGFDS